MGGWDVVGHLHGLGRPTGGGPVLGHHDGQHVAHVGGAAALGDEHRPVLVDDPHPQLAGHVGPGEHGHHAVDGLGRRGVDGHHVGPGVLGQVQGTVQQALGADVVDVGPVAQGQLPGLVLDAPAAHPAGHLGGRGLALGQGFHRVQDLGVAGAATQMAAQVAGGLLAGQLRSLAVHQRLGADENAGGAETALEGAAGGEHVGHAGPLLVGNPFQGHHLGAFRTLQRGLAGHPGPAVHQHRAAAALAAGRAAVLGRHDPQFISQSGQQVLVLPPDGHRLSVDGQRGHGMPPWWPEVSPLVGAASAVV